MTDVPIEGQVVLLTAAKASVTGKRLATLLETVQDGLGPEIDTYRRQYELAHEDEDARCFFVSTDRWESIGNDLGFCRREREAVRRAHEEQMKRFGKRADRREEFETALEVRSAVVIGT